MYLCNFWLLCNYEYIVSTCDASKYTSWIHSVVNKQVLWLVIIENCYKFTKVILSQDLFTNHAVDPTIVLKIHKSVCIPLLVEKSLSIIIIIIIEFAFHKKIQIIQKQTCCMHELLNVKSSSPLSRMSFFYYVFFALLSYVNIDFCFELPNGNIGGILLFLEITVCNYYLKKSKKSSKLQCSDW